MRKTLMNNSTDISKIFTSSKSEGWEHWEQNDATELTRKSAPRQ